MLQVFCAVVQDELMRIIIHHGKKLSAFSDNRFSLAPGEDCSEQTRDLDVLFFSEGMRNGYRIILNETRLVVEIRFFVKELLELS